jgi:hypothetical protein
MFDSRRVRVVISGSLLIAACAFSVAWAQTPIHSLQVAIPFDFYVGGKLLPAGDYQAAPLVNNVVRLFNAATRESATFRTMSLNRTLGEITSAKLVFNNYGDDHFLAEMWWGQGSAGVSPIPTPLEIKLAKAVRPIRVEARARR